MSLIRLSLRSMLNTALFNGPRLCQRTPVKSVTYAHPAFLLGRPRTIPGFRWTSSSPPPVGAGSGGGEGGAVVKQSLFARFKAMYKDYWYVLVPVHVVTSLGWITGFYYFVKSGVDLGYYMKKVGISESVVDKVTNSGAGHLAVAYALYKIATPARYTVTLGGTTLAINRLRNMGYIKPAKEIYSNNKNKIQQQIQKRKELKDKKSKR